MNIQLISLLGCLVVGLSSVSAQKVKWCATSQNEWNKCQHLATKSPELECHLKYSVFECMRSIRTGDADAMTVDGEHMYLAGLLPYRFRPIIAEHTKKKCCYAVAVVKKDTDFTINDLKGKTSCHSCYRRPGGWNIPIGRLVAQNKIPWDGLDDMPLEKAVSQFFSSSCIPGISRARYPNLCQACQGDCSCSHNEKYYSDEGALQCFKSGHGQVAFVCQDAIPPSERQNYQLLCMDGSRKSVEEYKDCYLAKEPRRAVVSRMDADSQQIYKVLKQIPDSELFSSAAFGDKDLMFSDSASELLELPKSTDSFIFLRKDYYEAMRALREGNTPAPSLHRRIEWCTVSHAEHRKCDSLMIPGLDCIRASSVEDCIKKIMRGEADAIAVDSGHVYIAGKCGLVPVMVEQYNQESCDNGGSSQWHIRQARTVGGTHVFMIRRSETYVVAVVHKGSGVTWNSLKGRKSCHTGLNTDAGWNVPLSVICGNRADCNLYNFFSKGCAPGADPQSNMSLAEKTGEVAFIKHTTVVEYMDGSGPDWARDLKSDDFELICPESPNESVKHTDYDKCHLAKVPAHAVITREDARADVVNFLNKAQADSDRLFKSEGKRNLLFSDSTKCLQEITESVEDFLTKNHVDMIERTYATGQGAPDLVKACNLTFCVWT
ncbi:hypothetical protein G5714_002478 [Onychostoma macrolepis]|uniref:Serotransferrin n=1 Tax=Onychostoma macrolepis TaxID=369639 RepID=A0A7J6DFY9_9TELE|nr:hypothetical protein G5714_002478 [Onychostoma macrolepis]